MLKINIGDIVVFKDWYAKKIGFKEGVICQVTRFMREDYDG